ncbi:hypothetical protein GUI43_00825 [Micromonospora noduli]|nr:hypothetical protein GUI43_00825 [Micromonospora noduli]RAO20126.1 hypothetical protein LUPAC07_01624 [Micromonospora noduli]RAO58805.1 hypothetical protein ONO86_00165 [Micromonospora noduli]
MNAYLGRLLGEVGAALLNIDGSVCGSFAEYPARRRVKWARERFATSAPVLDTSKYP